MLSLLSVLSLWHGASSSRRGDHDAVLARDAGSGSSRGESRGCSTRRNDRGARRSCPGAGDERSAASKSVDAAQAGCRLVREAPRKADLRLSGGISGNRRRLRRRSRPRPRYPRATGRRSLRRAHDLHASCRRTRRREDEDPSSHAAHSQDGRCGAALRAESTVIRPIEYDSTYEPPAPTVPIVVSGSKGSLAASRRLRSILPS